MGNFAHIEKSLSLLSIRDRRILIVLTLFAILISFLDLVGVALIGAVTSLSITNLGQQQAGNRLLQTLRLIGIDGLPFQTQIVILGVGASVFLVGKTLLSMYLYKRSLQIMANRAARLSAELVSKFLLLPVSDVNKRSAQDSIYALTGGVNVVTIGILGSLVLLVSDLSLLLVLAAGLFIVEPTAALVSLSLFGLVSIVLYRSIHSHMSDLGTQQAKLTIESSQRIFESISSYRELLVRGRRQFYAEEIANLRLRLVNGTARITFLNVVPKYVLEVFLIIASLLLAYFQFQSESIFRAVATVSIFVAASTRILPALIRIQQGVLSLKVSSAQANPTFSLMDLISKVKMSDSIIKGLSRNHAKFSPEVKMSNVTFSYDGESAVLRDINLEIKAGEFIAIVGGSGAGKTTLVDVLLGALIPSEGFVTIHGTTPQCVYRNWPGAVAYVSQNSPIIDGTVKENLTLGFNSDDVEDEYCWESLRAARLEDFVRNLPQGLNTQVGDRGTRLSGGQKQRLGIARGLLTRPKLLILDEATSSLDGVTESELTEGLLEFKSEATLLIIAHRLSTILKADRIYFMKDGQFLGNGNFEYLRKQIPEFASQVDAMNIMKKS